MIQREEAPVMNFPLRSSRAIRGAQLALAATLLLLHAPQLARAQADEPMIYSVGLVALETPGQPWAFLHWKSTDFDLYAPRVWSVWRKDGLPDSPGSYALEAVVQAQTSPAVIAGLIERAVKALGEPSGALRQALNALFEDSLPSGQLTDAEVASAVIQAAMTNLEHLNSLQLIMRSFPSMAMALGTGHATPIPAAGPVTFEIRIRSSLTASDEAVVGRVTVDAANPVILPAPTVVGLAPPDPQRPATSDLAIRMRWDTPPALARMGLAQHGFDVWRVARAYVEERNWKADPPHAWELVTGSIAMPNLMGRVNQHPVLARAIDAGVAQQPDNHEVYFATDHASRFPGYPANHTPPKNGDEYYYFVAARNLLGQHGEVSNGLLAMFCSRMPPMVPRALGVTNFYSYDQASQTSSQKLSFRWRANPVEEDKRTDYYAVYRWNSTKEFYEFSGADPLHGLIGFVPHVEGQAEFFLLDDGPGSPTAPADQDKTYWYTVRAIDDNGRDDENNLIFCATPPFTGNPSGHSPPRFGVLRDYVGPDSPTGGIVIRCAEPFADIVRETRLITDREPQAETAVSVEFLVERLGGADPSLSWVELYWGVGETSVLIGRFEFESEEPEFRHRHAFPAVFENATIQVWARVGGPDGKFAETDRLSILLPAAGSGNIREVTVAAGMIYEGHLISRDDPRRPCRGHSVPPEGSGGPDDGAIEGKIQLKPGATQYKVYFRMDDGPLTLLLEDSGDFPPDTDISFLMAAVPVYASDLCFFVQSYDKHGNPSPLVPLGCTGVNFKLKLRKPILAPIQSSGDEGSARARIQWFAPRWGVHRFELLIHGSPLPPDDLSSDLIPNGTVLQPILVDGNVTFKSFKSYLTEPLGPAFGETGSSFAVELPIGSEVTWEVTVRGRTEFGTKGPRSNREEFTWAPPELFIGEDVPWPHRKVPATWPSAYFNFRVAAASGPSGGGMVRIGEVLGRVDRNFENTAWKLTYQGNPINKVYWDDPLFLPEAWPKLPPRSLFPLALYRMQVPNAIWPDVVGDIVQVSPLMEGIAHRQFDGMTEIYDPYIHISEAVGSASDPNILYLIDTQPAVRGARYRYLLVLFDKATMEIDRVLTTADVDL
jgi:hypothetical protein